jgi:hypothetical protein
MPVIGGQVFNFDWFDGVCWFEVENTAVKTKRVIKGTFNIFGTAKTIQYTVISRAYLW